MVVLEMTRKDEHDYLHQFSVICLERTWSYSGILNTFIRNFIPYEPADTNREVISAKIRRRGDLRTQRFLYVFHKRPPCTL
jgi:hypothetical protein